MLNLTWLVEGDYRFPPTSKALTDPNGLLAVGGDLKPERLISAYSKGIFPWYSDGQPILWWSPAPRTVFIPSKIHCSQSMAKFARKCDWLVTIDCAFEEVIEACSQAREADGGTWITTPMKRAYCQLHEQGFAHSAEVWSGQQLVGGIYGVSLGRIFFGESMFSRASNGSKFALLNFGRFLAQNNFELLDAQVANDHLKRMGSVEMTREEFERRLHLNTTTALIDSMQTLWRCALGKTIDREGHFQT